jgi:hypothetical protein
VWRAISFSESFWIHNRSVGRHSRFRFLSRSSSEESNCGSRRSGLWSSTIYRKAPLWKFQCLRRKWSCFWMFWELSSLKGDYYSFGLILCFMHNSLQQSAMKRITIDAFYPDIRDSIAPTIKQIILDCLKRKLHMRSLSTENIDQIWTEMDSKLQTGSILEWQTLISKIPPDWPMFSKLARRKTLFW